MSGERDPLDGTTEDLLEDAPSGYVSTRVDGTIVWVNRTFEAWTGLSRGDLVGARRFQDLLSAGGRMYYETHYAPLLHMQGSVQAIAVEIVRSDGSRLPALVNSVLRRDDDGRPHAVWTSVFDATDRRAYEDELLRARQREREIAQHLQRSMLTGTLPDPKGCEIAVLYRAAVSGMEVGGDWYDAFWLDEDQTIGLVVGDVVGRGIEAAATMGQLRSAVRALASTGIPPGTLLERLDAYARRYEVGKMCTLVYAELRLSEGLLRYACAGHPPPLLAVPGEEPRFAWGGRSTPLAARGSRDEAAEALRPGTVILLYTDGLVERRSRPLDEGMELVRSEVAAHAHAAVSAILDGVIRVVSDLEHPDDVCMLGARLAVAQAPG